MALHGVLELFKARIRPNVLIVGAGIAGIQAAVEITLDWLMFSAAVSVAVILGLLAAVHPAY